MECEIEFLKMIIGYCQAIRRTRTRPDLAIEAAKWELKLNQQLVELTKQTELSLRLRKEEAA